MESDAILGLALLGVSLAILVALVVWSRLRIDRIAKRGYRSARQILKEDRR